MRRLLFAGLAGVILVGCGAVGSETTISADGSFERKIAVTMADMGDMPGAEAPDPASVISLDGADSWETETAESSRGLRFIASRSFAAGENSETGFSLMAGDNPFVTSEVNVVKRADGMIEYTETYTWVGEEPEGMIGDDQMLADLSEHLKPLGATDADIEKIAKGTVERMWPHMFGPNDTLMIELFVNFSVVEKKLLRVMGMSLLGSVEENMPNTTEAQRLKAVRAIISAVKLDEVVQTSPEGLVDNPMDMPAEEEEESNDDMVGLTAVVIGPGKLIETNGEYDPITGEVFWTFYSQAAVPGPVILKAVFDPSAKFQP